jgi:hypothetical protein
MNEEILKLAYSLNFLVIKQGVASLTEEHLEAFYCAAYNKGLMDARNELHKHDDDYITERAILALEMKK